MIQIRRNEHEAYRNVDITKSTIMYGELASHLGYNGETHNPVLEVAIDGGRTTSVFKDDEMTVVDGQMIQINW